MEQDRQEQQRWTSGNDMLILPYQSIEGRRGSMLVLDRTGSISAWSGNNYIGTVRLLNMGVRMSDAAAMNDNGVSDGKPNETAEQ